MLDPEDLFDSGTEGTEPKGFQIIAAVANTYKALRHPFLETDSAIELMSALSWDPALTQEWISVMRVLDGEIFEYPKVYQQWRDFMYSALTARINTLDDISRAACLNYAYQSWVTWTDMNPAVYLRPFKQSAGTLTHISGVMGSGKTDLGCTIADYALREGWTVVTNINFIGELPEGLIRTVRLSELMLEMIDARLEKRDVVVLFDEVSMFFSRREAGRSGNIDLEKLLRLTRKFRSSVIFIEQVKGGLPSVALELLTARFHKLGKKKCQYSTRNLEKNYNLLLDSIPRTKLQFDTWHMGGFKPDIDLGEIFRDDAMIEGAQEEALRAAIQKAVNKKKKGGGRSG